MFDVGGLPVLTFGNCVLKTGVIKWPLKLYVRFKRFLRFLSCFTRFLERYASPTGRAKVSMVKYMDIAVRSLTCHAATGTHVPCRITRCYLPPDRGDIPAFTPAEAGTRLSDPGGMQG